MYNLKCPNCGIFVDIDVHQKCPDCRWHFERARHFDHFDTQIQPEELEWREQQATLDAQARDIQAAFNENGEAIPRLPTRRRTRRDVPPPEEVLPVPMEDEEDDTYDVELDSERDEDEDIDEEEEDDERSDDIAF